MVADIFPPATRGQAIGIYYIAILVAPIIGVRRMVCVSCLVSYVVPPCSHRILLCDMLVVFVGHTLRIHLHTHSRCLVALSHKREDGALRSISLVRMPACC